MPAAALPPVASVLRHIALLRGINVGGNNLIPMAELRTVCMKLGWSDVQTYIQSGNVIFAASESVPALEAALERAIAKRFGLAIPVIVRPANAWRAHLKSNPFSEASESQPNLVMLGVSKSAPARDAAVRLGEYASAGESIVQAGGALWIHYGSGSARSKITPARLDRLAGSPVTTRNWRTVVKLAELAGPSPGPVSGR